MSCEYCLKKFNFKSRIPKTLKCSHTYCNKCLQILIDNLEYCPIDRSKINNSVLINKENFESISFLCKIHQSPNVGLCCSHVQLICNICSSEHASCNTITLCEAKIYEYIKDIYEIGLYYSSYLVAILKENKNNNLAPTFTILDLKIKEIKDFIVEINRIGNLPTNITNKLSMIKKIKDIKPSKDTKKLNEIVKINFNTDIAPTNNDLTNCILSLWNDPTFSDCMRNMLLPYTNHIYCYKNKIYGTPLWQKLEKYLCPNYMPIFLFNETKIEASINKSYECCIKNSFQNNYIISQFAIGTPSQPNEKLIIRSIILTVNDQNYLNGPYLVEYEPMEVAKLITLNQFVPWALNNHLLIKVELEGENNYVFCDPFSDNVSTTRLDGLKYDQNFPILFFNLTNNFNSF